MIKFLIKKFIKNHDDISDNTVRAKYALLSGILGIISNISLFIIKLVSGFIMGSITVISDSFNNLSDTGSSVVTLIGTKLSNAHADKEHPFGHGRIEYISPLVVSFIIIFVGFELVKSSALRIINPQKISLNIYIVLILVVTLLVKLWMFLYNKYMGNKINSKLLLATAKDSINDVFSTSAIILSSVVDSFIPFSIDGYTGLIVSLFIIFSGYKIAKDTIDSLIGTPPDRELTNNIKNIILESKYISGIHDLIIHDYGPGRIMASVHAEVSADSDIIVIHDLIDSIESNIEKNLGVHIVIHMDPVTTSCEKTNSIKKYIEECLLKINDKLSIHDFRMSEGEFKINLIFDLCVPFDIGENERKNILSILSSKVKEKDERYNLIVRIDNLF